MGQSMVESVGLAFSVSHTCGYTPEPCVYACHLARVMIAMRVVCRLDAAAGQSVMVGPEWLLVKPIVVGIRKP